MADARGIGLFEVIAATLIATLAVLGLAYSFGVGRGLIDRYQIARAAMGEASLVVDSLALTVAPASLTPGNRPFAVGGMMAGTTSWTLSNVDDPVDGLAPADLEPIDLLRIRVTVGWTLGGALDTLGLERTVLAP